MEHPNPFELEKQPEEKEGWTMDIHESGLGKEAKKSLAELVLLEAGMPGWTKITAIAEWLPKNKPEGFGYKAVLELQVEKVKKWAIVWKLEEGEISVYDTLKELFDPKNITDEIRLRLGRSKKLHELARKAKMEDGLRLNSNPKYPPYFPENE
jgi:hypothetical protein